MILPKKIYIKKSKSSRNLIHKLQSKYSHPSNTRFFYHKILNIVKLHMSKKINLIPVKGEIIQNLSNDKFRVKLENGVYVIAHLAGKIRKNRIRVSVGDKVTVELSPYDLTKGRIIYRF